MTDYESVMKKMRLLVPAMKKVDDETLTAWIGMAEMFVCSKRFGDKFNDALALYTLHIMFLQGAFKQTEDINAYGRKVAQYALTGEYQITYKHDAVDLSAKSIRQTPWGIMYETLNRKKGGGFGLIGGQHRPCGGRFLNGL